MSKEENTNPLENLEIIKHLLFDKEAYDEYVKEMLDRFLKDNPDEYTYWDAWFRKAEGEDMNKAAEGIPYVKKSIESMKKEEVFDDIVTDTDEDAMQWSKVCESCANKEEVLKLGIVSSDSGEGICGVKGCQNESVSYIDF
jgi:hypothetical protein